MSESDTIMRVGFCEAHYAEFLEMGGRASRFHAVYRKRECAVEGCRHAVRRWEKPFNVDGEQRER